MKKLIILLLSANLLISLAGLSWAAMFDINILHDVMLEMDAAVLSANNYCVNQTQDIEGLQSKLSSNPIAKEEYLHWLDAMSDMDTLAIDYSGNVVRTSTSSTSDNVFSSRYLKKLKEEAEKDTDILTPLNFSITYVDREQLQQDALWYMTQKMVELNDRLGTARYGLYRVDPATLDVKVDIKATPINLKDITTNRTTQEQYRKLFGAEVTDAPTGVISNSDKVMSNVVVKYDITYYVYYDYIPSSVFFKVTNSTVTARGIATMDHPPADLYFPFWYTKDGSINPDKSKRLSRPVKKFYPQRYREYSFSYILTN